MNGVKFMICLVVVSAGVLAPGLHSAANNSEARPNPALMNACLITNDVGQLVNF